MKTPTKLTRALGFLLGAAVFAPATLFAQMNYQGRLTDSSGNALPDGQYTLEFRLFDAATAGNEVWGPFTLDGTTVAGHGAQAYVVNGRFNAILGSVDGAATPRSAAAR